LLELGFGKRSDVAKAELEKLRFKMWGEKGRVRDTGYPVTPLSFIETQNFQIRLRHAENLVQIEVAKNRRHRKSLE